MAGSVVAQEQRGIGLLDPVPESTTIRDIGKDELPLIKRERTGTIIATE